jgi:hypothetical protein
MSEIVSKEELNEALHGDKKVESCPVHGDEPPAINVGGLLMAKHDLDGRWCICCLLEFAKKHGCHRLTA